MWPGWVHILFGLDTRFREAEASFFNIGKRTEDVLLNHLHDLIEMREYQGLDVLLFLQKFFKVSDGCQTFRLKEIKRSGESNYSVDFSNTYFSFDVSGFIAVVEILRAQLDLPNKGLARWRFCQK